jgi:hypothetical protein
MNTITWHEARDQPHIEIAPYDRWISPGGVTIAEFHRATNGFLVRFPDQVDFAICPAALEVAAYPAPGSALPYLQNLYRNSLLPMLSNYRGDLNLHGSAVLIDGVAAAFIGHSRSGKTTLAAALAREGYPFLTEDVVNIGHLGGKPAVQPDRPVLRLFEDSALFLLGTAPNWQDTAIKNPLGASDALPFHPEPAELATIFLLGPGTASDVCVHAMGPAQAAAGLGQHSFILDVEDRGRMAEHFGRLAGLAATVDCQMLDYPRKYEALPEVIATITSHIAKIRR